MFRTRTGAWVGACLLAAALTAGTTTASAHTGGSNCQDTLTVPEVGTGAQGSCEFPFQGWPLGVAGVYKVHPDATRRGAEIHVELKARTAAGGPPRPLGIECSQYGATDVARCKLEDNPFAAPITAVQPVPAEIVSIVCEGHSHASYSRLLPPSGIFACWSTDAGRQDLEADGVMAQIGY